MIEDQERTIEVHNTTEHYEQLQAVHFQLPLGIWWMHVHHVYRESEPAKDSHASPLNTHELLPYMTYKHRVPEGKLSIICDI